MMNAALSAGRLYRSPGFLREFGATNPEWNLAHSYPFQSLDFRVFSQALNVSMSFYCKEKKLSCVLYCVPACYVCSCMRDHFQAANA